MTLKCVYENNVCSILLLYAPCYVTEMYQENFNKNLNYTVVSGSFQLSLVTIASGNSAHTRVQVHYKVQILVENSPLI